MDNLKPCPFCGGEAIMTKRYNRFSEWWLISCKKCHISQTGSEFEFSFEAIEAWNRRVPQTEVHQYGENCTHISNCGTLNLNL